MQLEFEAIQPDSNESFSVYRQVLPAFDCPYHFHPEIELTLIENSCGTRLVGDRLDRFEKGNLALIGANVPHRYYNDPSPDGNPEWARSIVIQFREDFLGASFLMAGEVRSIRELLRSAQSGLQITGALREALVPQVQQLLQRKGMDRLLGLLGILNQLAGAEADMAPIFDSRAILRVSQSDARRMEKAFRLIHDHHRKELDLATVATGIGMAPSSFSRFFRQKTGKTFSLFLIETRLTDACQQLLTTDQSVTEICYTCGFTNLSNFNRQFKRFKGMSPRAFRSTWRG